MLRFKKYLFYFLLGVGMALGFYAVLVEPFTLKVKQWSVETIKWKGQKELKVALLSDLHMIRPWMTPEHVARIVAETNALKPDVVLLLGDYVGDHFFGVQIKPEDGVAPLKKLSAPCGVYAVPGNHDLYHLLDIPYAVSKTAGWLEAVAATGIPLLVNQAQRVDCGAGEFWVAGLADQRMQLPDIAKTLQQVTDDKPVIMMMHNPDSFPAVPSSVALSVAGHMHNGQVRIPFYGAVETVLPSRYGLRYVYGHIREEGKDLVVSGGLGMTALPIRFLAPPEITLVTLKSAE